MAEKDSLLESEKRSHSLYCDDDLIRNENTSPKDKIKQEENFFSCLEIEKEIILKSKRDYFDQTLESKQLPELDLEQEYKMEKTDFTTKLFERLTVLNRRIDEVFGRSIEPLFPQISAYFDISNNSINYQDLPEEKKDLWLDGIELNRYDRKGQLKIIRQQILELDELSYRFFSSMWIITKNLVMIMKTKTMDYNEELDIMHKYPFIQIYRSLIDLSCRLSMNMKTFQLQNDIYIHNEVKNYFNQQWNLDSLKYLSVAERRKQILLDLSFDMKSLYSNFYEVSFHKTVAKHLQQLLNLSDEFVSEMENFLKALTPIKVL